MPEATQPSLTGGDTSIAAQPSAPSSGAPLASGVQTTGDAGAGTAKGASLQSAGAGVDLDTLFARPDVQELIERKFVKPAVSKVSANREKLLGEIEADVRQRLSLEQLQAQQDVLIRQAGSTDPKVATDARLRLGELSLAEYQRRQAAASQMTARKQLEAEIATSLATTVFGIPADQIPADALEAPNKLADWAITQSPKVKAAIEAALKQAGSDTRAIDMAAQAAQFGAKLQATPSPSFGSGSAGGSGEILPMTQAEFDRIRGNPDARREAGTKARIVAGVQAKLITY